MAGAVTIQKQSQVVIGGVAYGIGVSAVATSSAEVQATLPAAATGVLTVRTSNTVGTLTMTTGAGGLSTACVFDLYWAGGSRRGVIAGTVAGSSVPITGGTGDNLPIATTAITAQIPTSFPLAVVGNNLQALAMIGGAGAFTMFSIQSVAPAELFAVPNLPTGFGYDWLTGCGVANPLLAVTADHVLISNGDSTQPTTVRLSAAFN